MARFVTGNELNNELGKILERADDQLIIISPYIKLHDRYKSFLKTKINNPYLKIIVVFGKNEGDISKSMSKDEFEFFKQFPNVDIKYEKRLHAKFYANENTALITSMNLYNYSQDTNIESGILTKATLLGSLRISIKDDMVGQDALDYFFTVIEQSELIFEKVPEFEKANFGLTKRYSKSVIKTDESEAFFANKKYKKTYKKIVKKKKIEQNKVASKKVDKKTGYCIRTGKEIPFNIEKPMSYEAFKMWNKYKDADYQEKYCHFSGEKSNGNTSVNKPILKENWKKAKEMHDL